MLSPPAKEKDCIITESPEKERIKVIRGSFSLRETGAEERSFIPDVISKIPQKIPSKSGFSKTASGMTVLSTSRNAEKNTIIPVTFKIPRAASARASGRAVKIPHPLRGRGRAFFSVRILRSISPAVSEAEIWLIYIMKPYNALLKKPAPTTETAKAGPALFVKQRSFKASFSEIRFCLKRSQTFFAPVG